MSTCPGCGLPGERCFTVFGELLAQSYTDPDRRAVHQLIVDSYIAQHPGGTTRQEAQSVAVCLMTLQMFIEDGADPAQGPWLHRTMADHGVNFTYLHRDAPSDPVTVVDVASNPNYEDAVWVWARHVWSTWEPHHQQIRDWNHQVFAEKAAAV